MVDEVDYFSFTKVRLLVPALIPDLDENQPQASFTS
jgi:hypothetical protein